MALVNHYQEQFNAGQLGKLLRARSDRPYYRQGCKTLINFRPSIQGPAIKRKGTVYVAEVKDSSESVLLAEFIFSDIDSYVLEFGDQYLRFYQGTSQVESASVPYEISTPYNYTDLSKLKFAQLGDIMYIAHPDYKPRKLTRLGATNWTLAEVDYQLGPVQDVNETSTTLSVGGSKAEGGTSTWTASANVFVASDVGTVWKISDHSAGTTHGYAKMTSFASATEADFENQTDLNHMSSATTFWNYPSWSDTFGWPRAVAFHEQRLFFAGNNEAPLTVYGSVVGSFENFDVDDASADDALQFELAGRINTIQWLRSDSDFLVAGTYGGLGFIEFQVQNDVVTPKARIGTRYGSSDIQGIELGDRVVYSHSNNKSLYEAAYNDVSLKYEALDLNDGNPDILENGITQMKVVEQPDLAAITVSNGDLDIVSRDRVQEVLGWYQYQFNGEIESVAVIPTSGEDRIWVSVKRTINGSIKRYVEYIETASVDRYVDSSIYYSGSATRTLSGLSHLEGETVSVLGDGSYAGDYTVSSGSITLPDSKTAISEAYIGLPYQADLEPMPIVLELQEFGSTQMMLGRVVSANLMLYQTLGLKIGGTSATLDVLPFRNTNDPMTSALTKFGNTYPDIYEDIPIESDVTRSPTLYIRSDLPFSCTVLGLSCKLEVNQN